MLSQKAITQGGQSTKVQWQKQNLYEFVNSQRANGHACTKYVSGRMFGRQYLCPTKTNTTKACTTRTTLKEESRGTKENYNKMERRTATRRRRATKTTTTKNNNHHHHHRHQQAHKQRRQRRSSRRLIGKHNSGIKPPPTTRCPSCGMYSVRSESLSEMFKQTEINGDRPCPALQL